MVWLLPVVRLVTPVKSVVVMSVPANAQLTTTSAVGM